MTFTLNPLLATDSYKQSHKDMYPEGFDYLESNYTNRGSRVEGVAHVVHFGLQAWLKDFTESWEKFFAAPKADVIAEYKEHVDTFVSPGFSLKEAEDLHDLGYLPLRFDAVPEGTLVPLKVPSVLIKSTNRKFAWLVNFIESDLSAGIWHPSTVATIAWDLRRIFNKAAEDTGGAPEATDWQLHDFSYRGQVNREAAAASGAAHLLSSLGSDAIPAVPWVKYYYPGDNGLIAASVPATEHSVMCVGGEEDEIETFRRLLKLYPEGILSIVSDTWDFFRVLTVILPQLKDEIMARNGKLVIRPDSGDPADIVTGTVKFQLNPKSAKAYALSVEQAKKAQEFGVDLGHGIPASYKPVTTPEEKGAIEVLWDLFGGTVNEKGFKELDSHIGLIYGDGMFPDRIRDINARLAAKGFASTNWVAGVGSYAYQYVTRDTFASAVKATYAEVNGVGRNIQKNPKTDDGTKKSATGRLAVGTSQNTGDLYRIEKAEDWQIENSRLLPIWEDGKFIREYSFAQVRKNLATNTALLERTGVLV
jgi:nicotinamide phosphoribosyltransferase